jgi:hypothetical protein
MVVVIHYGHTEEDILAEVQAHGITLRDIAEGQ